ncbi:hypothetical protein GCM10010347_63350 [Streptomyces cirratus]|uniref:Uncharacterized protein n=1 Tax=Streptomyces cirratus TaxID=68187 RepID=A0ABQ3F2I1_9ACTN|nr:hypothetical protein GCM10010347_63350 [Streptomyces cirratus]
MAGSGESGSLVGLITAKRGTVEDEPSPGTIHAHVPLDGLLPMESEVKHRLGGQPFTLTQESRSHRPVPGS